jgi:hypothetical protein
MDMAASLAGENSSKTEPIHQPLWYLLQIVPRMGDDMETTRPISALLWSSSTPRHLRCRDDCGLWVLRGARGYISTRDDSATALVVFELPTARQWNFRRDVLAAFAEVTGTPTPTVVSFSDGCQRSTRTCDQGYPGDREDARGTAGSAKAGPDTVWLSMIAERGVLLIE